MDVASKTKQDLTGRERLLAVALELFTEDGFEGVSIQQIATAAGMTKGSPYYHFKSKEDLFLQALQQHINGMTRDFSRVFETELPLREKLIAAFEQMMATINPGIIRILDDFHRLFVMSRKCEPSVVGDPQEVFRSLYAQAFVESGLELRLPPEDVADALVALQMGMLHMKIMAAMPPGPNPPAAIATISGKGIIDLFLDGAIVPGQ